jgi:hypothetical protein
MKLLTAEELAAITNRATYGVDSRDSIYADRIALVGHIYALSSTPTAKGCYIHGECPHCRAARVAGDPRTSVSVDVRSGD